ncbi:MAG: hypothetical protein OES46_04505 [Gammaproteobacteria bacterium]|nr:hypothetical protein [Gammaproteobacteria bacterium]
MEAITPSTHYVAARVKWLTVTLAPLLTALIVWAAMEVVKNYLSGKGDPNTWVTGFVLALLGSLTLVFLASIPWAFRARILLTGDRMTVRGLVRTRVITEGQIEGFRWINGQPHLYLKARQWPVQLSHYENQRVINAWVFRHAQDLGEQELVAEDVAINRDLALGMTAAQKEARLAKLRKVMRGVNLLAYCGAVIGVVNVLFLEQDTVAKAAAAILVSIPILLDVLALRNRGHIRIDYQEGTRYPQIFSGTMVCGIGVVLVSLLDRSTLIGDEFYQWFVPVAVAKGLLWLFIDLDRIRTLHARGWFALTITAMSLMLLPAFWVGGSIYQVNQHLDSSRVTWHSTEVIDKKVSKGKTISYSIKVAPWTPSLDEPPELAVRRKQFKQIEVGMPIEIGVREGALEIPWVAEIKLTPL